MIQNTQTAKSNRAEYILDRSLVLDELHGLVNDCWMQAYGKQFELHEMYDFLPQDDFGKIPIFNELIDIIANNGKANFNELLNIIDKHFHDGIFSNLFYRFVRPKNLIMTFILKDEIINGENEIFTLISHIKISDYRSPSEYSVEAFTQPIIDCEEEVLKSLLWHELRR